MTTDPNWWKRWQYDGKLPAVVCDFANSLYWDGSTTSASPSALVTNAGTITAGVGMAIGGATNITANGALKSAFQGPAYNVQMSTVGGSPSQNLIILSDANGNAVYGTNTGGGGVVSQFLTYPPLLEASPGSGVDMSLTAWGSVSVTSALRRLSGIGPGSATTSAAGAHAADTNGYTVNPSSITLGSWGGSGFPFDGSIAQIAVGPATLPDAVIPPPAFTGVNGWWWAGDSAANIDFGNILNYEYTQPWTVIAAVCMLGSNNSGVTGVDGVIYSNVPNGFGFPGHEIFVNGASKLHARIIHGVGANMIGVYGSTVLANGKWRIIALTNDGSGLASGVKLYVDGTLETMTVEEDDLNGMSIVGTGPAANDFHVGNQTAFGFGLPGAIGFFRFFNAVKSQAYIQTYVENQPLPDVSADSSCVLNLMLQEGAGLSGTNVTTKDQSANGFTGTLSSASQWLRGMSPLEIHGVGAVGAAGRFDFPVPLVGAGASTAAGNLGKIGGVALPSAPASASAGNFAVTATNITNVNLTGAGASGAAGLFTVTIQNAVNVNLTGVGAATAAGSFANAIASPLTGAAGASAAGAFTKAPAPPLASAGASASAGTFGVITGSTLNVNLTGAAGVASPGNFVSAAASGAALIGAGAVAAAGDWLATNTTALAGAAAAGSAGAFLNAIALPTFAGAPAIGGAGAFSKQLLQFTGAGAAGLASTWQISGTVAPAPPTQRIAKVPGELRVVFVPVDLTSVGA